MISLQAHTCALFCFKSNGPVQYGPSIYCRNKLFMRAISRAAASFLEGIAVSQHSHVSADVSVHYIGQRRAYQAKTCSLSGPLPFVLAPSPPSITPSAHCHSSCWLHPRLPRCPPQRSGLIECVQGSEALARTSFVTQTDSSARRGKEDCGPL